MELVVLGHGTWHARHAVEGGPDVLVRAVGVLGPLEELLRRGVLEDVLHESPCDHDVCIACEHGRVVGWWQFLLGCPGDELPHFVVVLPTLLLEG